MGASLTRLLGNVLYEITPTDVPAFALATIALFIVALLASYVPARRVARHYPTVALRQE